MPNTMCFEVGWMGSMRKLMLPFRATTALTPKIHEVPMYKKLLSIQCLHPELGSCLSCRLLCFLEQCIPYQSRVQCFPLQMLYHVRRPLLWCQVMMNYSLHAYTLLEANTLHWLQKWLCCRAISQCKHLVVPMLNK